MPETVNDPPGFSHRQLTTMRPRPFRRRPLRVILALCHLLAFHANASHPENPPVTDCLCPEEVQLISDHDTDEEGNYKLTASVNGTFNIEVLAIPPSQGNPATPTLLFRDKHGKEIVSEQAWTHEFSIPALGLESPITLEVTAPCSGYGSDGHSLCDQKYFVFGCDAGDCGTGGTCQSGAGSPSGDVDPGSEEPFKFSVPIGSSSQGDESTGLHFNAKPGTPIGIADFKIHSNGGHTQNINSNTITTGTTVTTLSGSSGAVTVNITKTGGTEPFKTYVFTSNTTAKTLTLVETSCSQPPVTHQWAENSGTLSYSSANGMRVKTAFIVSNQNFVRIEQHQIKDGNDVLVSDEKLHYKTYPWGTRLIKREIDPDTENLTSTWTYGAPTDGAAYGRLMEHTRHDGHVEAHSYGTTYHQVDYAGGRQVRTDWTGNTTTITEKLGGTIIDKTEEIRNGNIHTLKRYVNLNESLDTVTTYETTGVDFGGHPLLVMHPDGTATKYTYTRPTENYAIVRKITAENGLLDGGLITDGTITVTTTNARGHVIEESTSDIATNIKLAHTKAALLDGHDRPVTIHHFPYGSGNFVYQEKRAYSCCGLVSETDRHGVITHHAYDALKRRIRTHRIGVTTETHYLGLATETHRIAENLELEEEDILSSDLMGDENTLVAKETRNLSGTLIESETPDPTSDVPGSVVLSHRTETVYAPEAAISRRVTTSVPGGHKQVEEYNLDGSLYQTYGVLSPSMRHTRQVSQTETGLFETQAYLTNLVIEETEGTLTSATEVGPVTTQSDWAGRTIFTNQGGMTQTHGYYGKVGTGNPPVPVGSGGKLRSVFDADLVATLYAYNDQGERVVTAIDLDENNTITYGIDQITRSESFVTTRPGNPVIPVIRTETKVWQDATSQQSNGIETTISYTERTPNGLESWSWQIGYGETHVTTPYGLSRSETTTRPDDTYTVSTYSGGMLHTLESFDSDDILITSLTYDYDNLNRLETTLDSRTGTTTIAYLSPTADFVVSSSEADTPPRVTLFAYDSRGRQTTVTLPNNTETYTIYTPRGEPETRWGSQIYPEFRTYDYAGRLRTLRTKPDIDPITEIPVNDGGSLTTWNYYTDTGLLWQKLDHENKGPVYTYTAAGRLQTRQWARGRLTVYDYTRGRMTGIAYYGTDALWQDYLAKRELWLDLLDDEQATQQEIDDAEDEMNAARTANDSAPDTTTPNLGYTHDTLGRVRTVTRGGSNHADYVYDPATLRLVTEKLNRDTHERHLYRHYDTYGRPLSLNLATTAGVSQYTTGYGHDNAGRLDRVWHHPALTNGVPQGNPTFTYSYSYTQASAGAMRVGATTGVNLKQDFMPYTVTRNASDPSHILTANRTYEGTRDVLHTIENKAGANVVSSYTYEVNSLGQRDSVDTAGSAFSGTPADWDWYYDTLGQLELAVHGTTQASRRAYEYDFIGNRKKFGHGAAGLPQSDNYGSNALNQYTLVPSYSPQPSHDADGNLTRGPVPGSNGNIPGVQPPTDATEIKWDGENRMSSWILGEGINRVFYNYEYDHRSRLIATRIDGSIGRRYHYDGWNRIAEYSSTSLIDTFTWGLDLSGTLQGAGGVGGLLATRWASSGNLDFIATYDGNGNVSEYLWPTGIIASHYEYDPFGTLTRLLGNNSPRFQYRFSTKPRNHNTGLYYYLYRWYDPVTGRWPSRDPIGDEAFLKNLNLAESPLSITDYREQTDEPEYLMVHNELIGNYDINGLFNPALGATAAVVGILSTCALPYHIVASTKYSDRSDKFRHCWVSCKISRTCGGYVAEVAGLGKEARDRAVGELCRLFPNNPLCGGGHGDFMDSLNDLIANQQCIGWESLVFGPVGGWVGSLCRDSCEDCCNKKYP